MIYLTEAGSVYQVDHEKKMVRRLSGTKSPTDRQGQDGEWKQFIGIAFGSNGRIFFEWEVGKGTVTSRVLKTQEEWVYFKERADLAS